jgi:uncharacterized protein (DUF58 family)
MSTSGRRFALVPQRRFVGVRFGERRSSRRGPGDEVAGTRPYRPGDRRSWIDWRASARLSAARGQDEFVVREFFADNAPRVVIVIDRRPRMGIYASPLPWLDKPAVVDAAVRLIGDSAAAERGDLGLVDESDGRVRWIAPRAPLDAVATWERGRRNAALDARPQSLERCFRTLTRHAAILPSGTFVFVLSDFVDAVPLRAWARLRSHRLDVTPVVVQDPTWEQSFPKLNGVLLPVLDPTGGSRGEVWIGAREASRQAQANERRLGDLLVGFERLGFDPVVLGSTAPEAIAAAFSRWSQRRSRLRRRSA